MTLDGPVTPVLEETTLEIKCNVRLGNPPCEMSINWEFQPRYIAKFPQGPLEPKHEKIVRINKAEYTHAGIYRCTAENEAGSDSAETEIVVLCT